MHIGLVALMCCIHPNMQRQQASQQHRQLGGHTFRHCTGGEWRLTAGVQREHLTLLYTVGQTQTRTHYPFQVKHAALQGWGSSRNIWICSRTKIWPNRTPVLHSLEDRDRVQQRGGRGQVGNEQELSITQVDRKERETSVTPWEAVSASGLWQHEDGRCPRGRKAMFHL